MRLSSRRANPVGAAFVLCAANPESIHGIVDAVRPYLLSLQPGIISYRDDQGEEQEATEWDSYLDIIEMGATDRDEGELAARLLAAGFVAAHETLNLEPVRPHVEERIYHGLAKIALRDLA